MLVGLIYIKFNNFQCVHTFCDIEITQFAFSSVSIFVFEMYLLKKQEETTEVERKKRS